jgi:hypothetical protein
MQDDIFRAMNHSAPSPSMRSKDGDDGADEHEKRV